MKFLVCTDGTPGSRAIFAPAGRLASALGAEIVVARVLDDRVDAADVVAPKLEDAVAQVEARWKDELRAALAEAGLSGEVVVPKRVWGKEIADAVHAAADETGAALVAIASRGAGKVHHALFGSVAMGVISRADLPVLTLAPDGPKPAGTGMYHLVVTSDGSPPSRSIFSALEPLLVPGKVKVTLLEVVTMKAQETEAEAESRARAGLEELLSRLPAGVEASAHVQATAANSDIARVIGETASRLGAEAIASATHGHSAKRHVVVGSTALGVVERSGLPVILVKSSVA